MATRLLRRAKAGVFTLATTNSGVLVYAAIGNLALRMLSSIVLTRLLVPEAFGIIGIIGSISFVVVMMGDLGFNAYIIRDRRGDEPHFLNTLWTIHIVRGLIFTIVGAAITPLLSTILQKPALTWPAMAAMTTLAITGFQSFGSITTLRHGGAKRLTAFDFCTTVVQVVVNIIAAIWLRNVWALIVAMIVSTLFKTIASYFVFPGVRHRLTFDWTISREFLGFSKMVATSSAITLVMAQSDKFILARLFTLSEFGIYGIALTLAATSSTFAESYISRVIYPKYTQAAREEQHQLGKFYYGVRHAQSLLYALACGGIIGGSHLIVAILYDPRYLGASVYLSILTLASLFRLPNYAAAEFLMAMGNYKPWLQSNIARLAWVATLGAAGFFAIGSLGIVIAVGTAEFAAFVYLSWRLHQANVFSLGKEAAFIGTAVVGAAIGYAFSIITHSLWPQL